MHITAVVGLATLTAMGMAQLAVASTAADDGKRSESCAEGAGKCQPLSFVEWRSVILIRTIPRRGCNVSCQLLAVLNP